MLARKQAHVSKIEAYVCTITILTPSVPRRWHEKVFEMVETINPVHREVIDHLRKRGEGKIESRPKDHQRQRWPNP